MSYGPATERKVAALEGGRGRAAFSCQAKGPVTPSIVTRFTARSRHPEQVSKPVPRTADVSTLHEQRQKLRVTLCSECNEGKKAFFASITDERVRHAIVYGSVHVRLGELLKTFAGQRVPKTYLQIVAYTHDDWEKRLRELRELGWRYHTERRKEQGRVRTYFILDHSEPWPSDAAAAIRDAEARKGTRRATARP